MAIWQSLNRRTAAWMLVAGTQSTTLHHLPLGIIGLISSANALVWERVLFIFQLPAIFSFCIFCNRAKQQREENKSTGVSCVSLFSAVHAPDFALCSASPAGKPLWRTPPPFFMTDLSGLSWDGTKPYLSSRQATPGSSFPSINSRLAPPPVLIWVILSA